MDSTTARFYNFLEGNAVMIEATLLLLSFVSVLLYYFDIPSSNLFLVRSVNLAALVYFFIASFGSFERKPHQITDVDPKIIAIGFTTAILGALFKLQNSPGQEMMVKIGVLSMSIGVLIWGFNSRRYWSNNLVALVIRITRITTLGLVLWFL